MIHSLSRIARGIVAVRGLFALLWIVALLLSCEPTLLANEQSATDVPDARPANDQPGNSETVKLQVATKPKPISVEEATEFAEELSEAVRTGNIKDFNRLIDWEGIAWKATETPKSPRVGRTREAFCEAAVGRLKSEDSLCRPLHTQVRDGGEYKNIQINLKDDEPYVMFRYQMGMNKGLNYHRIFLKRGSDGSVQGSDLYIFLTAERVSDALNRNWKLATKSLERTNLEILFQLKDPYLANIQLFQKFAKLATEQQSAAEALTIYRQLPDVLQQDKNALVLRMMAAQVVSDEEYISAINDFRKYHPGDPATDFLLIGGYRVRKKYAEALECLDRTNKLLDGDPMLLVARAHLLLELNRVSEARAAIEAAILEEPELRSIYEMGIDVSLADLNFEETVKYLTILETQFDVTWKNLHEVEAFEEFVKSVQYQNWAATQPNQNK